MADVTAGDLFDLCCDVDAQLAGALALLDPMAVNGELSNDGYRAIRLLSHIETQLGKLKEALDGARIIPAAIVIESPSASLN